MLLSEKNKVIFDLIFFFLIYTSKGLSLGILQKLIVF